MLSLCNEKPAHSKTRLIRGVSSKACDPLIILEFHTGLKNKPKN